MTEARLGLLLCGAGRVVERLYGPALRRSRRVRAVAVVDPREERRGWASRALGVPAYASVAAALAAEKPDAAVVATPPAYHVEVASELLLAGLPVLIEKPAARTAAEAAALLAVAGELPLRVALSRRYWRHYQPRAAPNRVVASTGWAVEMMTPVGRWGAIEPAGERTTADLLDDLLPHAYDIATSALAGDLSEVREARVDDSMVRLALADGGVITLADGPGWRETVVGRGVSVEGCDWFLYGSRLTKGRAFVAGAARTALARAGVRTLEPVEAVARLLDDFAEDVRLGRRNDDLTRLARLFDAVREKLTEA